MIKEDSVDDADEIESDATPKGRTGSSLNPLLIESGNDDGNGKIKKEQKGNILFRIWGLTGDKQNGKWMIGLHAMSVCSVILTLSMWIYFW